MSRQFHDRHFPVRPNLDQLKRQAKELLRDFRENDAGAVHAFQKHQVTHLDALNAKLADAQFVLARSYGLADWPRLVIACRMTDAIWRGDVETVRQLVTARPQLLHEAARGLPDSNWGPPMSYAANVGQDAIVRMLRDLGATDLQHAFDRACLQGKIDTARRLYQMGARPQPGCVLGPCETLNDAGLAFLLELGADFADANGDHFAPVALLLQTYCRYPDGKHRCLEMAAEHGIALPDSPPMAMHRGRIDLLEEHLRRDPRLPMRTFSHEEIYSTALGCSADPSFALHGTPLDGTTLLHMCVDFDEIEIARWLLAHGADVNARARTDADGFGGHTPLFNAVISQAYLCGRQKDGAFPKLLLDAGADPNARASLRKRLRFVADESVHEYRNVTPLAWGTQFHGERFHGWVSKPAMSLIAQAGGHS
jgi:ankyrin repeat protein